MWKNDNIFRSGLVNSITFRKSSLITVGKTTGQRKKSFVSFEEKSETIEVREEEAVGKEEEGNEEAMEEEDVLSRLRSEKEGEVIGGEDGEEEEEEEEVVAYSRRWTDSLKINRKKSKQEQEKGKESGWWQAWKSKTTFSP